MKLLRLFFLMVAAFIAIQLQLFARSNLNISDLEEISGGACVNVVCVNSDFCHALSCRFSPCNTCGTSYRTSYCGNTPATTPCINFIDPVGCSKYYVNCYCDGLHCHNAPHENYTCEITDYDCSRITCTDPSEQ